MTQGYRGSRYCRVYLPVKGRTSLPVYLTQRMEPPNFADEDTNCLKVILKFVEAKLVVVAILVKAFKVIHCGQIPDAASEDEGRPVFLNGANQALTLLLFLDSLFNSWEEPSVHSTGAVWRS